MLKATFSPGCVEFRTLVPSAIMLPEIGCFLASRRIFSTTPVSLVAAISHLHHGLYVVHTINLRFLHISVAPGHFSKPTTNT
jgi:hypothetical protein